jgi:ATP-dependent DNA helicase RecG
MQFPILPDARDRQCSIGQDAKFRKENKIMAENQNTEYKQNWPDDHLRWICGFANADGGKLYIGVNDHGTVSGIENHKYLIDEIPSKIRNLLGITANVNLKTIDQKYYIEIEVEHYNVPISLRGRYYYRTGSTNTELTGNALNAFLLRKIGKSWDDVDLESWNIDQIDIQTINHFKKLALDRLPGISDENDLGTILKKLNLIDHEKLKRAAILLFGTDTQKTFIHAHIRIGKFISDSDIVSSDIVTGNLFQQIEQTLSILKK